MSDRQPTPGVHEHMPRPLDRAARVCYEGRFAGELARVPDWDKLPEYAKDRWRDAVSAVLNAAPAPESHLRMLDWTGFRGIRINKEWMPEDQELIYTAMNVCDGEGDMDDDAREQIIERLLFAWQNAEMAAVMFNAHRHELLEKLDAHPPQPRPLSAVLNAACKSEPGSVCDPVTIASEAAVYFSRFCDPVLSPRDAAVKVLDVMPPNSTYYERGLAAGMAFTLAALKPPSPQSHVSVPDGWKLAPEIPTDAMVDAGLYQSSHDADYSSVCQAYMDMVKIAPNPDGAPAPVPHLRGNDE